MYQVKSTSIDKECGITKSSSNLSKLKILTDALPFADMVTKTEKSNYIEVEADGGSIFGFGLYKNKLIAVVRVYASKGAFMERHNHNEKEIFILYSGAMTVNINDKKYELAPLDIFYIDPGTPHSVKFNEETWAITLTIPASESFPEGM